MVVIKLHILNFTFSPYVLIFTQMASYEFPKHVHILCMSLKVTDIVSLFVFK